MCVCGGGGGNQGTRQEDCLQRWSLPTIDLSQAGRCSIKMRINSHTVVEEATWSAGQYGHRGHQKPAGGPLGSAAVNGDNWISVVNCELRYWVIF